MYLLLILYYYIISLLLFIRTFVFSFNRQHMRIENYTINWKFYRSENVMLRRDCFYLSLQLARRATRSDATHIHTHTRRWSIRVVRFAFSPSSRRQSALELFSKLGGCNVEGSIARNRRDECFLNYAETFARGRRALSGMHIIQTSCVSRSTIRELCVSRSFIINEVTFFFLAQSVRISRLPLTRRSAKRSVFFNARRSQKRSSFTINEIPLASCARERRSRN